MRSRTILGLLFVLVMSIITSTVGPVDAQTSVVSDDFNYAASDPGLPKWQHVVQQQHTDGTRHELWVADPYLYSENRSCQPSIDFDTTWSGCGMDATMDSVGTLPYVVSSGQRMVLTERYSPAKRDASLCWVWWPGNPVLNLNPNPPDDYSMHWIGLRDSTNTGTSFVYIIVEHACIGPDWRYGLVAYYSDTNAVSRYVGWTNWVINDNEWLDFTIEIGSNGQDTRLTAKNTSTGLSYFTTLATNLGSASTSVEIAVQYRHNEFSRTDFVDARINDPDFGISANSPLNICPGTSNGATVTATSLRGFSGTVSLSSSMDRTSSYVSQYLSSNALTLSSGGSAVTSLFFSAQNNGNAQGMYVVVVTGTSSSISHNTAVTVNVSYNYCGGGGGGGGGCDPLPCKETPGAMFRTEANTRS